MAEQLKYTFAEDSEGGFHILKFNNIYYNEIATAARLPEARLITKALNEKEDRDRVARDAALHNSVDSEAEADSPVQPHSVDPDDKRPVFVVGDK